MARLARKVEVHGRLGEDTNWPKGYSWSVNKVQKEEGRGRCLEWWHLSSHITIRCDGAVLCWRWLNGCLPMGRCKLTPCLIILYVWILFFQLNCLHLTPPVFHLLSARFSPWSCWWGSEWAAVGGLAAVGVKAQDITSLLTQIPTLYSVTSIHSPKHTYLHMHCVAYFINPAAANSTS